MVGLAIAVGGTGVCVAAAGGAAVGASGTGVFDGVPVTTTCCTMTTGVGSGVCGHDDYDGRDLAGGAVEHALNRTVRNPMVAGVLVHLPLGTLASAAASHRIPMLIPATE